MRKFFENRQMGRGAMIVAIVALCVGLGGGAYAATLTLKNKSVTTKKLKNGAVTTKKLKTGAVTGEKLAAGAVAGKVSIIKQPGETVNPTAGNSVAGTITCPAGYQAIAGQAALVNPLNTDSNMGIISSRRDDSNPALWLIRVGTDEGNQSWQLSATCIKFD
jgi:hypothetical protein